MIEKKLIKEYEKYNLYGIYKNKKLLYKTTESKIHDKLGIRGDAIQKLS